MALSLTTNFVEKVNSVLPLAQSQNGLAVRVASLASDIIGTLTAINANAAPVWSLQNAPTWVTLSVDTTGLIATISYASAVFQPTPYEFFIQIFDGVSNLFFPIFLEVKEPFSIGVVGNTSGLIQIQSFDNTVADIVINGFGLNGSQVGGCNFELPGTLPNGLSFVTSDETKLVLRVADPNATNNDFSGGLKLNPQTSQQIQILAYHPASFYDRPDRAFKGNFTIFSATVKPGTPDLGLATFTDPITSFTHLDAHVQYLQGQSQVLTYSYTLTPSAGAINIQSGSLTGSVPTNGVIPALVVSNTVTANIAVQLTVSAAGVVVATKNIASIPVAAVGSWGATTKAKINLDADVKQGFGDGTTAVSVTISTPVGEAGGGEDFTLTFSVVAASSIEAVISAPASIHLTAGNGYSNTTSLTFPVTAGLRQKWVLTVVATSGTRSGYAQVLYESNGLPTQSITLTGGNSILSNTGSLITPVVLNSTATPSVTFELVGAPDGLFVNNQNQLAGNALLPGTYTFQVSGTKIGFARGFSSNVTLTVTQVAVPLVISNPSSSVTQIQDNTQFVVQWGISGTLSDSQSQLFLEQQPSPNAPRNVVGATQATLTQVGTNVYSIFGANFFGTSYAVPLCVVSSSIQTLQQLLPSPTIAVIDEFFQLVANWQPFAVNSGYSIYKGWNIFLENPPGTAAVKTFTTGGTGVNRQFTEQLTAGDFSMNMTALSSDHTQALDSNAWDSDHTFPQTLTAASVVFDNTNLQLGQTLTVSLDPTYAGADAWQVFWPDNTSTGWLPMSVRSVAKSFQKSGALDVVVQTQRDFGTANPQVKLRRQITKQIFVLNQQFNVSGTQSGALTGTIGIAGTQGFEITDATTGVVEPQPFELAVRAIVRDTVTNELKLLVATSRFSDASSLLGTMAMDVFAVQGRPSAKEVLVPPTGLLTTSKTSSIPVKIQTTTLPNIVVGKPMTEFKLSAIGGTTPYSWFSDSLPSGLKLSIDGTLSGNPLLLGVFEVNFAVQDNSSPFFIDEITLPLVIQTDLVIVQDTIPDATVGTSYNFLLTNTGGLPPFTWSIAAGALPIGMSIDPASGNLQGVPCTYNSTSDFNKTFTFTVQIQDAIGARVSKVFTMRLKPAALTLGIPNQTIVYAQEQFKIAVPVFGGFSPYSLVQFSDDGVVGSGLAITNPTTVNLTAGQTPPNLTISTGDQTFFPQSYPANIEFFLAATGGVAPYRFFVDTTAANSLLNPACYGNLVIGNPQLDGTYSVSIKAVDSVGHITIKVIHVRTQQQNTGVYTIQAVTVNPNGAPTNPSAWTVTALPAGLPDAQRNTAYTPGGGSFYGYQLYENGNLHFDQTGAGPKMAFSIIGNLPTGITATSADSQFGITTASGTILIQGTPTVNGSSSYEVEFTNIVTQTNTIVVQVRREALTIVTTPVGTTAVVVVTSTTELDIDLAAVSGSPFPWFYPLTAEGGAGAPYTFQLLSGTTLPGAQLTTVNGLPAFASATTQTGSFLVNVQAKGSAGILSPNTLIPVVLTQTQTQPIHILGNSIPAFLYVNRPIPANTYFVDADLVANWTANGLPAGVTLTTAPGTRVYLTGTPTAVTQGATVTITATSATFGSQASQTFQFQIRAQSAQIINKPSTATVGTQYRVVNNNAIISVQFVGFQPGDQNLPTLSNTVVGNTLGAPGVSIGSQPSTGNSNLTPDGFIMEFDYLPTVAGNDTITLTGTTTLDSVTLSVVFPLLVATPQTITQTVSEYSTTAQLNPPVSISGGNSPYSINITAVSDSRFVPVNNQTATAKLQITVAQFVAGSSFNCAVSMTITDTESPQQSVQVTGTVSVTIKQETTIQVLFQDFEWDIAWETEPFSAFTIIPQDSAVPQLGHTPFQYFVDSVTVPPALINLLGSGRNFVVVSPTNRVLAINVNETNATVSEPDVDATLNPSGSFNVLAVSATQATSITPGTYSIACALRVVDSKGISASATKNIVLKVS